MSFTGLSQGIALLLVTFLMAVQPVYTKQLEESLPYNPLKEDTLPSEEGILRLTLPEALVRKAIEDAVLISETNKEAFVKEITRFKLDPLQNLIIVAGTAILPANIVFDMNDIAGGGDFPAEHKFNISFKLPSDRKLAVTRYFSLEIVEFKIDGQDYLNAFNRLSQYLVGLLANTSFMDWVLEVEESNIGNSENLSFKIKNLIESKGLRFRGNSVSFKLDLERIDALKAYSSLANLRLWNVLPVLLKGTDVIALQIEAGLGKPADVWFDAVAERGESDGHTLEEARKELYAQFGDAQVLVKEVSEYMELTKENLQFPLWEKRQINEFKSLKSHIESRARKALDIKNPLFLADPQIQYELTKSDLKEHAVNVLTDIKKKAFTMVTLKESGKNSQNMAFLTKRLSQSTLSQGVRFARDFKFENEQLFPELYVVIAPHIPGVVIRGVMNMDLNVFMEMGLEGEGIEWSATPWRPAEDVWGSGIPFEVSLRLHAFDKGVLGLDVVNFSILTDSEKTTLSKASGHGQIISGWTKMAIVEALTTLAIEDPLAVSQGDNGPEGREDPHLRTLKKIQEQSLEYRTEMARIFDGDLGALVKLAEIDIERNPFNQAGSIQAQTKLRYLFEDIIKYDDDHGMMTFKLDPKLASETILASENTVEVWNIESLYSEVLNQTFIEVAVGDGNRSKKFVNKIFNRDEYFNSQDFVGIDESRDQVPSDLIASSNLKHFENFLNRLFNEASVEQTKGVNKALSSNVEQSHYIMKDLSLSAISDGVIGIGLVMSHITKEKKSALGRLFSNSDWNVEQKTIQVNARLNLSVEKLSRYLGQVKLSSNEVFFGDEVLKIDIEGAGLKFTGSTSVLEKIVGLVARDIDFKGGAIAKMVKKVVMNFLHSYLNDQDPKKNGNTTLGGVRINRYAKLLAHNEELLIQLNPHLMGVAYDIRLLNNQRFNGKELGLTISKAQESIDFHFSTSGNLAAVDKGELMRVMVKTAELFDPYITGKKELTDSELTMLFDRSLYNSDYTKLSLFHRLKRVMKYYDGVLNVIKPDTSVVDQINQNLNTDFGISLGSVNGRRLTGSGVEIMYFLAAAATLRDKLASLVKLNKGSDLSRSTLMAMKNKVNEIDDRFIGPLLKVYSEKFHQRNQKIMKKGPTDWNYTYYPDALFNEGVFDFLKNWSQKNGR